MRVDFEQYLMEKYSEIIDCTEETCTDDEFHDKFCDWIENMNPENMIEYGNKYAKEIKRRIDYMITINGVNYEKNS